MKLLLKEREQVTCFRIEFGEEFGPAEWPSCAVANSSVNQNKLVFLAISLRLRVKKLLDCLFLLEVQAT